MDLNAIESKIEYLNRVKCFLNEKEDETNLEDVVYHSYLGLESVTNVMKKVNSLGFRKDKNSQKLKYDTNDISLILQKKDVKVNLELKNIVQRMFKANKKGVRQRW